MKSLPEHLADFLMTQKDKSLLAYRKRCMELWRDAYGDSVVIEVEKLVKSRWLKNDSSGS